MSYSSSCYCCKNSSHQNSSNINSSRSIKQQVYWTHSLLLPLTFPPSLPLAILSAVRPEIRARQSWMAPKHSLGLFRLRANSDVGVDIRRKRRLAGCAGVQFADSASVVVEDAPRRQRLLQSSGKSAVAATRRQSSIDSADSRQLQMVCDRDRDTKAVRVALQL